MIEVLNRRHALQALAGFLAGSPLLRAQQDPFRDHTRVPSIRELLNAFDFEAVAYAKQPRVAYDYRAYGADSEFTLRRNREAYDWVELVPRRVASADAPKTATELFGTKMAYPLMVSPTAFQVQLHPDAEIATHKGAEAASATPMIVSNNSSVTFEKIAAASPSPLWVQLYPKQQMDQNQSYIEAAQASGARALVVTVDQQASVYERASHDRNLGGTPLRRFTQGPVTPANPYRITNNRLWYEWKFFDDLRKFTKIPIMAKGIVTGEDARICVERGLDAVYVSNHGGRSLDYGPSTLEVLPEIVDAVGGKVPVIFDGGIRRGTDILKALALGANAVCIGRVPMWGLGSFGANGVQRVLEILQAELLDAMRNTGRASLASIDKSIALTNFP